MIKITLAIVLATTFIACKKESKESPESTETQYLRIEEVDKDGHTTVSPVITVKIIN